MTTEKENVNVFKAKLIAETVRYGVRFRIYSNRIFHVTVPKFHKINHDAVNAGYSFLNENGGGRFYNIYEFHSFSDVEPEIREWAADSNGNHNTHTDAIVIGSPSQKIMTDFYLRFNRPVKPTKIFYSLTKAVEWTLVQIQKKNPDL